MKSQSLIALAGGLLLSGAALACTNCEEHAKAEAKATVSTTEGADGMIAVRDPVTGQLRAPTADELAALQAKSQTAKSTRARALSATAAPAARVNAFGAVGFRPGPENVSYSVVTRNADGSLSSTCVQGQDQAEAIVKGQVAKSANKE
ncbi:post-PEP-CTERM-1 domain-containing protein [Roseateles sp. DB2]|uniref:post-PEP-CTERM-1 domain-containing protein n=1 Tax=Roseateles sp. DB2 TaxID=3453717 RepID=UPI003EEE3B75